MTVTFVAWLFHGRCFGLHRLSVDYAGTVGSGNTQVFVCDEHFILRVTWRCEMMWMDLTPSDTQLDPMGPTFLSAIFMWPTCQVIHSHMDPYGHSSRWAPFFRCKIGVPLGEVSKSLCWLIMCEGLLYHEINYPNNPKHAGNADGTNPHYHFCKYIYI